MPKISIIVPVYNTEKYLDQCLDSLINQTLTDIEIICIDDGSTDNSLKILEEYKEKDNRIKVFSQKNQGPAVARNFGISKVTGEYIIFVDSDDWVNINMCEKFYNKAKENNVDIVLSTYHKVTDINVAIDNRLQIIKNNVATEIFNAEDEITNIIPNIPYETVCKFYKTDFIKNNNILFPQNIKLAEDCCFIINALLFNPKITYIEDALYYYRINTSNSLVKKPDAVKNLYSVFLYVRKILFNSNFKNKDELYYCFLTRLIIACLSYWNSCHTISYKKYGIKYLRNLKKYYNMLPDKNPKTYNYLKQSLFDYEILFFTKLFEPLIEFENRTTRFVIYLFGNQVLNISKIPFRSTYNNFFYNIILLKLRFISRFRKIRVGFWVTETSKWAQQPFFEKLKNSKHFEPFILLSYFKKPQGNELPKDYYYNAKEYFEKLGNKVYDTFNADDYTFENLTDFKPDIIFYQQPWLIPGKQIIKKNSKHSLLCYIPYCFYSTNSYVNYLSHFHGIMWKYFVETEYHKKEYKNFYGATNCVPVGSIKLDNYKNIDNELSEKHWKYKNKKRIIYAPHHSFNDGIHEVATFQHNGQFILDLAKKLPETEWIFRPHPAFIDRLIKNSIMTIDEIEKYYKEWEEIGSVSTGGNYYEIFNSSDCLITDCISFLSEYAPTENPVLHLRKDGQKNIFNSIVSKIDEAYYQIYNNEDLEKVFYEVIINNNDRLAPLRENNKDILNANTSASKNIFNYLKKELWINE